MNALIGLTAALAVIVPCLYIYAASAVPTRLPALRNKRICLLIAHPDDEAMFFAPTVLALTRTETGNHVKILCLSTGNADGLGETRKRELVKSGMALGLRDEDDVFVIDNPADFPDSMSVAWDENKIASLLRSAFVPQQRPTADVSANIDVLVTFDAGGVSSHPNHASLYHGARAFVAGLLQGKPASPVALYTLSSVNMLRKYSSIGDAVTTLAAYWMRARNDDGTNEGKDGKEAHPSGLVFMNSLTGEAALGTAWSAMTDAHKSQMVWFRYLWITFSRYMVINDLWLEEVREDGK